MSGHSKWATIKHTKQANDAKRGQIFTKIGQEIVIAVRKGGPDPDANFHLRLVLDKARRANMPKDNIERAIKRGSGELTDGRELFEGIYEGYGPHGIAILIHALTDNKNRAVSDIRRVLARHGGNLGSDGCVSWLFSRKGYMAVEPGDQDPEEVALAAIDAGAEDVEVGEGIVEIYTQVEDFKAVQETLAAATYKTASAQISWLPQTTMSLDEGETIKTMKLLDALEELEDVQEVYSNLEIADEAIARYEAQAA